MRTIILFFSILMMTGCATPVFHNTPSGKPEVTIYRANVAKIKTTIINKMIDAGMLVSKTDDLMLTFEKPLKDKSLMMIVGERPDTGHNARITFNLIQLSGAVRVVADSAVIYQAGTAWERRADFNNHQDSVQVQEWLNGLKKKFDGKI